MSANGSESIKAPLIGQKFKNDRYLIVDHVIEDGVTKSYVVEDREQDNAIKTMRIINSSDIDKEFLKNVENLRKLKKNFINITNYYDYFKIRFSNYLITEYFEVRFCLNFFY